MDSDTLFNSELAEAEAALQLSVKTYGPEGIAVSYRLDKVAELLRSKGLRALDAANMEARAKAIRIKQNEASISGANWKKSNDISEAMRNTSTRLRQERQAQNIKRALVAATCLFIGLVIVGKITSPSPDERHMVQHALDSAKSLLPTSTIEKGQSIAKDIETANKTHNDQLEQYSDK